MVSQICTSWQLPMLQSNLTPVLAASSPPPPQMPAAEQTVFGVAVCLAYSIAIGSRASVTYTGEKGPYQYKDAQTCCMGEYRKGLRVSQGTRPPCTWTPHLMTILLLGYTGTDKALNLIHSPGEELEIAEVIRDHASDSQTTLTCAIVRDLFERQSVRVC